MTQPVIHLVDDDASFRTAIGRVLEIAGYLRGSLSKIGQAVSGKFTAQRTRLHIA